MIDVPPPSLAPLLHGGKTGIFKAEGFGEAVWRRWRWGATPDKQPV